MKYGVTVDLLVLSIFVVLSFLYILWGIKNLPKEEWQFLASIPKQKIVDKDTWVGVNITYYGLLNANAYTMSVALFLTLNSMAKITLYQSMLIAFFILSLCIPASKFVARIVEGKSGTLTIGGALFVGFLITPIVLLLTNDLFETEIPTIPILASMMISYTYGEALGRLACLSFGCCYGRRIDDAHPLIKPFFRKFYCIFHGKTKKIAYESNLEGFKVIPVQAITSIFFLLVSILGLILYYNTHFITAFLLCLLSTQLWRVLSEFLRADFRGGKRFTPYQTMALVNILIGLIIITSLKAKPISIQPIIDSISNIINLPGILFLQGIWFITLLFTGISVVTSSEIKFKVNYDKV